MKSHARTRIPALLFAATNAALLGAPHLANAATANITTSVNTLIEPTSTFGGTTRVTAEGMLGTSNSTLWSYGVLDFSTVGTLPQQSVATSINSITLNLTDKAEGFAIAGTVDVYATDYTGSLSALRYKTDAASQPQGIGNSLDNLYKVGTITYTKTSGQLYTTTLDLSNPANANLTTFLVNQMNTGGIVRLAVAADSANMVGDFQGSSANASFASPYLKLDFNSTSVAAKNVLFSIAPGTNANNVANSNLGVTISGSGKAISVSIPRIVNTATLTQNITITNNGTDAGNYALVPSIGTASVATGSGTLGAQPVTASGGTSNITVGFNASTIMPGATTHGPISATLAVRDQSNAADADAVVTMTAQQIVATRFIDNQGANGTPLQFGKILAGATSTPLPVTLDTENTGTASFSNESLTKVQILASSNLTNATLNGLITGTNDKISVTNGAADQIFDSGSDTDTSRQVTFTAGTVGGLYQTNSFYDGYGTLPEINLDTAIGAANTTARIYVEADVYQAANVSSAATGNVITLTNAPHTVNTANATVGDIGARSAAFVTSVTLTNAQTGWTVDPGLNTSTSIGDGQTINAAAFDTTGKLNGTYTGKLAVGLQNDQSIFGAAPNDLGTSNISLTTTVTTNSGNGSANILANGSLAGYNIHRGAGKDSTIKFLAGTSTSGGNISVAWADGVNTTLSDKAAVGNSASNLYVLQMSYDGTAVTGSTSSPTLAANIGNKFIGAVNGDGAVTPVEINAAYDNNLVLGHYGIDTTNHVVWAVVNYAGDFEVTQRLSGDTNGDGTVNLADLTTVLNNFGASTALWSAGNFDGASTIDLTDLANVINHFGTSVPNASVATLGEVPEPASLGLLSLGLLPLLKRRRR